MQPSHSRFDVVVWSERKDQLPWLFCHGEALKRIGSVPAPWCCLWRFSRFLSSSVALPC